jgi:transcriptional regulator with XRE-family HTH domain
MTGSNPYLTEFGARLRRARKTAHYRRGGDAVTQGEAARRVGASKGSIATYERGEVSPTAEVLSRLATEYLAHADWLLTGEGDMWRDPNPPVMRTLTIELSEAACQRLEALATASSEYHSDVRWTIECEAAALLAQAIRRLPGDDPVHDDKD